MGVPFIPTPMSIVREALNITCIGENDVLYDLGAGDGRVVIEAAKRGAYAVAVEIDPYLAEVIRRKALEAGVSGRVGVVEASFYDVDLSRATAVYMYLYKSVNKELRGKLEKELAYGTRVITIDFPIPEWIPVVIKRVIDEKGVPRTIHVYIKGVSDRMALKKEVRPIDYRLLERIMKWIKLG